MKAHLLALLMLPSIAHADDTCHFERKVLFVSERPKATTVKPPLSALLLAKPAVKPKPKPKRKKVFDTHRRDGFDWICDDDQTTDAAPPASTVVVDLPAPEPVAPLAFDAPSAGSSISTAIPSEDDSGYGGVPADTPLAAMPLPYLPVVLLTPCCAAPVAAIPEPSTWLLMLAGVVAVALGARRSQTPTPRGASRGITD